jgi:hypothetical protein
MTNYDRSGSRRFVRVTSRRDYWPAAPSRAGLALAAGIAVFVALAAGPVAASDFAAGGGIVNGPSGNATAVGSGATTTGADATATGALSSATGLNATAMGFASTATGITATATGGGSTAIGASATATGQSSNARGDAATATGGFSNAIGLNATASGFNSTATGLTASAYGQNSSANGDATTAIGQASNAIAAGATAVGQGSTASGINATAIGTGATAAFANSAAFGAGATATAPNQIAVGTASNTYKMPGITSAASLAAQSGPTQVVTTDAAGHLAAAGFTGQDISTLQSNVGTLQTQMRQAFEGTAMAIALGGSALPADKKFAISTNWGTFRGENAMGLSAQMRLNDYVVMNGGVAAGFAERGVGGRAGLTVAW